MKGIKVLIILISVLTLIGCGKVESEIDIAQQEQEVLADNVDVMEDVNLQKSLEEETESQEDEEVVQIDTIEEVNTYMIPEQTFDVYLDDWGEVTFVSCKIPRSIFTDASFFLIKDEQILYKFPHRFKDNRLEFTGAFESVGAVAFCDVNDDKRDDIIIISYYVSGAGPTGMEPRPYVTIYLGGESEFYLAEDMMKEVEYNISGEDTTIQSVYNYLMERAQDSHDERNSENILPVDKVSVVGQTVSMDQVETDEAKMKL